MGTVRPACVALAVMLLGVLTAALAQANCRNTGAFEPWLAAVKKEALANGISQSASRRRHLHGA
jgi:membrane-bound lytic murein transglycosylase B